MRNTKNQIRTLLQRHTTNPLALDLLEKMLTFSPAKRFSVEQCLSHKYLAELHQDGDEPICKTPFDSFEDGYKEEMPKSLLQRYMRDTAAHLGTLTKLKS